MLRHIPNILTMGRLVLTVVFLIMILMAPKYYADGERPFPGFLDVAFILFVVAGLTDIADGIAARRLNVTSKFGRMVDPLADKILVCGAFTCFALIGEPKLFTLGPACWQSSIGGHWAYWRPEKFTSRSCVTSPRRAASTLPPPSPARSRCSFNLSLSARLSYGWLMFRTLPGDTGSRRSSLS